MPGLLVVDDFAAHRQLIRHLAEQAGWQVSEARNCQEAWHALQTRPVDAVALDVMLPACNGFTLLHDIRARLPDRNLPVILISALDKNFLAHQAAGLRVAGILSKPFSSHELLALLQQIQNDLSARSPTPDSGEDSL